MYIALAQRVLHASRKDSSLGTQTMRACECEGGLISGQRVSCTCKKRKMKESGTNGSYAKETTLRAEKGRANEALHTLIQARRFRYMGESCSEMASTSSSRQLQCGGQHGTHCDWANAARVPINARRGSATWKPPALELQLLPVGTHTKREAT